MKVALYGWIPTSVGPTDLEHIETGSEEELSDVDEGPMRKKRKKVKTAAELVDLVGELGYGLDEGLLKQLSKLK